ncbi:MAG: DNA polymerase IV [Thermoleophilaceae bacterium]|nr:DNA polymerase IV [Thermoleophilaceae bacterium]
MSVELARRPELRGLPVVVAGRSPRAVVTTASYEARRFGIFSATPAAQARRLCPEAVFVEPDFPAYRDRSRDVMAIVGEEIDRVETVGLDEAYLDLSDLERPATAARRLKATVRERTGLVCSIGIGPNKLVAKVASDAEKPDGFVVLSAPEARRRFGGEPPGLLPGIGPKTAARLASLGIDTLDRLAAAPEADLSGWFGPRLGRGIGRLARFEDDRALELARTAKSESRETTFHTDFRGVPALLPALEELGRELCERLRAQGRAGRTVGIKVRLDDFSTHTRARTLREATNDAVVVGSVAGELLRRFDPPRPVRLLGVKVAGLDASVGARTQPGRGRSDQLTLGELG